MYSKFGTFLNQANKDIHWIYCTFFIENNTSTFQKWRTTIFQAVVVVVVLWVVVVVVVIMCTAVDVHLERDSSRRRLIQDVQTMLVSLRRERSKSMRDGRGEKTLRRRSLKTKNGWQRFTRKKKKWKSLFTHLFHSSNLFC